MNKNNLVLTAYSKGILECNVIIFPIKTSCDFFAKYYGIITSCFDSSLAVLLLLSTLCWFPSDGYPSQQTLNVDSTLIYVEMTSRRWSTWYPRWFNVDLSTLIHRSNSTLKQRWFWLTLKQRWFWLTLKTIFFLYYVVEKLKSLY